MGLVEFFSFQWLTWQVPAGIGTFFDLTSSSFWIALICASAGAYVLSQQTTETGAFNFPVNLAALFLGAAVANWLGGGIALPLQPAMLVPVFYSLLGMCFVGLTIIWLVKKG
jgi:hypothetical protein